MGLAVRPGCEFEGMAISEDFHDSEVGRLLRAQAGLITRGQALAAGITDAALRHRLRPAGPWSYILPAVYCHTNEPLTHLQKEMAAVLYAGERSVVTGGSALLRLGFSVPMPDTVDILIPWAAGKQSYGFVRIHRTRRMPAQPRLAGQIRLAPAPRAVIDAIRAGMEPRAASAMVASAVQRRLCGLGDLVAEAQAGPAWGMAPVRDALADAIAGNRSAAEGDLRRLVTSGGIPKPLYNPRLLVGSVFLASPDAWWPDAGVAGEVDSAEYHLSPHDWRRTQERHARMTAHGIMVLHFAPSRLKRDGPAVIAELRLAIANGLARPRLPITTIPINGA